MDFQSIVDWIYSPQNSTPDLASNCGRYEMIAHTSDRRFRVKALRPWFKFLQTNKLHGYSRNVLFFASIAVHACGGLFKKGPEVWLRAFFWLLAIVYQNRIATRGKKQILLFLSRCRKELERKIVVTKWDLKVAQFWLADMAQFKLALKQCVLCTFSTLRGQNVAKS